ncbi:MAG: gamma carbonic anhydrase family protein [Acidobacteria bacterium]|nr:gamma carbonic anhydrase family protein [Acidobacteriota bacterium]MBI3426010.1 gamma carbonic anhydrase family protein [Acidobacteriota bacterium]
MIFEYSGKRPQIGQNVFIAPTAAIIGNVIIGDGASIWYGVVLRGDEGRIEIGRGSNVQDNSVIHTTPEIPTIIKDDVTIGHGALLEGCTIEHGAVVGMGSIVLHKAVVGEGAMTAAGSVVTPGTIIPPRTLAAGSPAMVKKELSGAALRSVEHSTLAYHHLRDVYRRQGLDDPASAL